MTGHTRLLLASLALGAAATVPAPAQATDPHTDTRPCADSREVNSTWAGMGRTDLEARWEVTGLGVRTWIAPIGYLVVYPWCGHGDTDHAYVALRYRGRTYTGYAVEYDCRWTGNTCP